MHLLNATSHSSISGGLDYQETIDETDLPVMSCSYSLAITIPAGTSSANGLVIIINDTIYEELEDFFLDLSVAPPFQDIGIYEGSPLRSRVEIEDEDGESAIFNLHYRSHI